MNIVLMISYSFILACSLLTIWHKLESKKINFKSKNLYYTLIGITIISLLNYFLINKFVKITIITIIFMFFFKFLFKENIQKSIITPIYYQLIIMVSETIYAFILILLFKNNSTTIIESHFGEFFSNVFISIISLLITNFKFVIKLYNKIINFTDKIKKYQLIIFSFILVIIANVFAVFSYYKIQFVYILLFNAIVTIISYAIILYSFKTQNSYNKVSDKYNIAINSLKDYEDMMSKYRVANHENKNLLLAIRAMILNKENDIPRYIDSIIKDKYNDNEKLLMKVNVIPSGGLRATIYSEILKIKDNNIKYSLYIDSALKTIDLIELDTNTIIDICKIIGVFIDNAIEEVKNLKEKNIGINLYLEKNLLNIEVSNNYKNSIDLEKIFDKGYTTKGKNHGYGLYLVKNIIDNNNIFENKVNISKKIFTQQLIIKYKKSR